MDNRVVATRLVLDKLGFGGSVDTMAERIEAQKLVFLVQQLDVGLGYSYSWYIKGPYSTSLTKAYYSAEWGMGDEALNKFRLTAAAQVAVGKINDLQQSRPAELPRWQWLELLASVAYLRRVSNLNEDQARQRISDQKGHLLAHYDAASRALRHVGLIQ